MELHSVDFNYLGLCLEAFFFGIYSAIFIMYINYHASKKRSDKGKSVLFFAICSLYILSIVTIILDLASVGIFLNMGPNPSLAKIRMMYDTEIIGFIVVGCCDFIAQSILIYRCWIVWSHNIRVVILPIILVFAFLATWVASITPLTIVQSQIVLEPPWSHKLLLFSLAASMAVNALVTGLIVFKIFKVFRGAKIQIPGGETLGSTGGSKLRSIIFILIESGSALFCIQLVRLIVTVLMTNTGVKVFDLVVGIHQMLNGLTPTIILVRVSMGLSFHDDKSMAEITTLRLRLHPPETDSTVIIIGQRMIRYHDDTFNDSGDIEKSEKSVDGSLL